MPTPTRFTAAVQVEVGGAWMEADLHDPIDGYTITTLKFYGKSPTELANLVSALKHQLTCVLHDLKDYDWGTDG